METFANLGFGSFDVVCWVCGSSNLYREAPPKILLMQDREMASALTVMADVLCVQR